MSGDPAAVENGDRTAEPHRLVQIMENDENRRAAFRPLRRDREDQLLKGEIETGGRFVEKQNAAFRLSELGEHAREMHPLLLSAGEMEVAFRVAIEKADALQRLINRLLLLLIRRAVRKAADRDDLTNREWKRQGRGLREAGSPPGEFAVLVIPQRTFMEKNSSFVGNGFTGQNPQKRAFARAVRTREDLNAPRPEPEIDVLNKNLPAGAHGNVRRP